MAAPNIVGVTTITGKTAVLAATTVATAIVANPAASGKVFKINALYVSNVDNIGSADISIDLFRSSTAYHISSAIEVVGNLPYYLLHVALFTLKKVIVLD